jgi:hypothetical protein
VPALAELHEPAGSDDRLQELEIVIAPRGERPNRAMIGTNPLLPGRIDRCFGHVRRCRELRIGEQRVGVVGVGKSGRTLTARCEERDGEEGCAER